MRDRHRAAAQRLGQDVGGGDGVLDFWCGGDARFAFYGFMR